MADKKDWKKSWVQAEKMIALGITLPIATVVGWLVGDLLDRKFHTAWIAIVGLMLGAIAGLTRLIQASMKIGAEDTKRDDSSK